MALVLLSGAGIVAIGIVRTGRDQATAQRELREEVERNVRTTARLVAEALTSQEARDRAEQDHRVFAEAGRVILPQWLEALTAAQRMEASAVAQHSEVLGAARRLEFVDGDVGAARKLLTQALQEAPGSGQLVLALAWLEDRAGDKVARDAWIARDEFPRTVPSLLLRARAGSTWPQGDRELLCALEPSEARAVLDRLEEVAPLVGARNRSRRVPGGGDPHRDRETRRARARGADRQ